MGTHSRINNLCWPWKFAALIRNLLTSSKLTSISLADWRRIKKKLLNHAETSDRSTENDFSRTADSSVCCDDCAKKQKIFKSLCENEEEKSEQLRSSSIRYVNCVWESSFLVGQRLGDGDETQVRFGSFEKDATATAVLVLDTSAWDDLTQSNTMLYRKKKESRPHTGKRMCVDI